MIIGITGTLGAGKGTVVEYLQTKGFKHYSARGVFNEEIARRGWVSNRDNMVIVANELREQYGSDFFARRALEKAHEYEGNAVIESIRTIGEANYLKSQGALLWAVDAEIHLRYERIQKRASETDKISFEKFQADERLEFANTDPTKQNLSEVMTMSDAIFYNNGTLEDLFRQVEQVLQKTK